MPSRPPSLKPARQRKPWMKRTTHGRLTGRRAVEQRRRRLAAEPLCRKCKERGIVRAATVPDHIKPLALGGSDDDSNIQCLCENCHREKTAEEQRLRRRGGDI